MSKTYTLEDGESLMAELKSTRGMMAEMRGRLERDEITPDEWRECDSGTGSSSRILCQAEFLRKQRNTLPVFGYSSNRLVQVCIGHGVLWCRGLMTGG